MTIDEACSAIARTHAAEVERRMLTHIEETEGRVPTNREIALYGQKLVNNRNLPFTDTWCWRGKTVFTVVWWEVPGVPYRFVEPVAP